MNHILIFTWLIKITHFYLFILRNFQKVSLRWIYNMHCRYVIAVFARYNQFLWYNKWKITASVIRWSLFCALETSKPEVDKEFYRLNLIGIEVDDNDNNGGVYITWPCVNPAVRFIYFHYYLMVFSSYD